MKDRVQQVKRLIEGMARLIDKMGEIDDTCLKLMENLGRRELALLCFIGDDEQVIMKDIAEKMDVPMSTTTGIVDKLVHKRYLDREYSKTDRRSINIVLTGNGQHVCNTMTNMKNQMADRMLDDLKEEEAEQFINLLEKITANLQKHVPAE